MLYKNGQCFYWVACSLAIFSHVRQFEHLFTGLYFIVKHVFLAILFLAFVWPHWGFHAYVNVSFETHWEATKLSFCCCEVKQYIRRVDSFYFNPSAVCMDCFSLTTAERKFRCFPMCLKTRAGKCMKNLITINFMQLQINFS